MILTMDEITLNGTYVDTTFERELQESYCIRNDKSPCSSEKLCTKKYCNFRNVQRCGDQNSAQYIVVAVAARLKYRHLQHEQ